MQAKGCARCGSTEHNVSHCPWPSTDDPPSPADPRPDRGELREAGPEGPPDKDGPMNLDDKHIHHPQLGQVPTAGDRFGAILKAAKRLHEIQTSQTAQAAANARIERRIALREAVLS